METKTQLDDLAPTADQGGGASAAASGTRWRDAIAAPVLSMRTRGYFRARMINNLHQLVLESFIEMESKGLTKEALAMRLGWSVREVENCLGSCGNYDFAIVSDLLLGMGLEASSEAVPLVTGQLEA